MIGALLYARFLPVSQILALIFWPSLCYLDSLDESLLHL